jgi:hypothetical protein
MSSPREKFGQGGESSQKAKISAPPFAHTLFKDPSTDPEATQRNIFTPWTPKQREILKAWDEKMGEKPRGWGAAETAEVVKWYTRDPEEAMDERRRAMDERRRAIGKAGKEYAEKRRRDIEKAKEYAEERRDEAEEYERRRLSERLTRIGRHDDDVPRRGGAEPKKSGRPDDAAVELRGIRTAKRAERAERAERAKRAAK